MQIQLTQQIVPLNIEERFQKVQELTELFTNGSYNPLDLKLLFKSWIDTIEATLENSTVKSAIDAELDKMPKSFTHLNCKVTKASKKTFDFSVCNDSYLDELYKEQQQLKDTIKQRETLLKAIDDNGMVNPDTGELLSAPLIRETEYLRITF